MSVTPRIQPIQNTDRVIFYRKLIFRLVPLAVGTCLLYACVHLYLGILPLVYVTIVLAFGYVFVLFTLRKSTVFFSHMRVFILMSYVGFTVQIYFTGGLFSSAFTHLLFIPLLGLFYGRNKDLKLFLSIVILSIFVWIVLYTLNIPEKNWVPFEKQNIFNLFNYLFIIAVVLLLGFFFKYEITTSHKKQKEAFIELQDAYQQLESQDKLASIGQMTAGIAHEINNPVNYMKMGALGISKLIDQLNNYRKERDKNWNSLNDIILLDDTDSRAKIKSILKEELNRDYQELFSDIREMVNSILVGADRTSEIVQSLKIFSRSSQDETKPVNIAECIDMALVLLETTSEDKVKFKKDLTKELPAIEGNFTQLFQVMMNLISNAIDAITDEGQISIKTSIENDEIVCVISDTGMGIDEKNLQTIFQPFFTTKAVGKGTGLGLSITKKIVEDHKGSISVISKKGEGTSFIIKFPVNSES